TSGNSTANFRGGNMKPRPLALFIVLSLFATLPIAVQIRAQKTQHQIITFDAGPNITNPTSINPEGEITGFYYDAHFRNHGFVRDRKGTITTFDVGPDGTYPESINPSGEITGFAFNLSVSSGFLRAADGTVTTIDLPGQGTRALSINPSGNITGWYIEIPGVTRGFLRTADGSITTFDVGSNITNPTSINSGGEITGFASSSGGASFQSFVRTADGT